MTLFGVAHLLLPLHRGRVIGVSLSLALVSGCANPLFADCLKYDPASITLTGRVIVEPFFGPPSYGKIPARDEKMHEPILKLAEPVCVDAMPKAAYDFRGEKNVSEMQMVFADYPFGAQWHGKRVIVTGKLFHAFTSAHRTKVLIMVKNARAVEEGR